MTKYRGALRSIVLGLILFQGCARVTATQSGSSAQLSVQREFGNFEPGDFYVSPSGDDASPGTLTRPFRTLERAKQAVRGINSAMTRDIVVYLRGGRYEQASTVAFGYQDSGTNGHYVTYRAYPGETPSLSGGRVISGWSYAGNGLYKAPVGNLRFRQLYVNGNRAIRARTPNVGDYKRLVTWDKINKQVVIKASDIAPWQNFTSVEMVSQNVWHPTIWRLASYTAAGTQAVVVPQEPERTWTFYNGTDVLAVLKDNQPFHFENAMEFLDSEGEWYLNSVTQELFYKPLAGENIFASEVIAPTVDTLVDLGGTNPDLPVKNLVFEGLTFEHTTWLIPDSMGFPAFWGDVLIGTPPPTTAVRLYFADNIHLVGNTFKHLGGSGLWLYYGTHNNLVDRNIFTDISSSGIRAGDNGFAHPADPRLTCTGDAITNNLIQSVGRDYLGGIGIFSIYTDTQTIEHNTIHDVPYIGIGTPVSLFTELTATRNNKIRYNHVFDVMNLLCDGSALYTNSNQPGTHYFQNYAHDIRMSPWVSPGAFGIGLYLDGATSNQIFTNNILLNVDTQIHFNPNPPHYNNYLANNEGNSAFVRSHSGVDSQRPVGLWSFEEGAGALAFDDSGEANTATLRNGVAWTNGVTGKALSFDGVDDSADVSATRDGSYRNSTLEPRSLSLSTWVKASSFANSGWYSSLVSQGANEWANGSFGLAFKTDGMPIAFLNIGGGQANSHTLAGPVLQTGQWYHLAMTYDHRRLKLYLNGTLVSEEIINKFRTINPDALVLGRRGDGVHFFNGALDQVGLFNYAMPADEVNYRYLLDADQAAFQLQQVPAGMVAGKTYPVSVTFTNTGLTSWTRDQQYRLGAQNPENNTTWSIGRVELEPGEVIPPGGQKTFNFTVTAPAAGIANFQWQMLKEGVHWFGSTSTNIAVNVIPSFPFPAPSPFPVPFVYASWSQGSSIKISKLNSATGQLVSTYSFNFVPPPTDRDGAKGWTARGFTAVKDGYGRILWTKPATGQAIIWLLDSAFNKVGEVAHQASAPAENWYATAFAKLGNGAGRLVWFNSGVTTAVVWPLAANDTYVGEPKKFYGLPATGPGPWVPISFSRAPDGTYRLGFTNGASGGASEIFYLDAQENIFSTQTVSYPAGWYLRSYYFESDGNLRVGLGNDGSGTGKICSFPSDVASIPMSNEGWGLQKCKTYGPEPGWTFRGISSFPY